MDSEKKQAMIRLRDSKQEIQDSFRDYLIHPGIVNGLHFTEKKHRYERAFFNLQTMRGMPEKF